MASTGDGQQLLDVVEHRGFIEGRVDDHPRKRGFEGNRIAEQYVSRDELHVALQTGVVTPVTG
jgi:hypothetical protein